MKHRLIVIAVCLAMFLAVLGVRSFKVESAPLDEILAYEVDVDRGVEVTLHGGVEQVSLTSWLWLPLDTPAEEELPYALEVRLTDTDGSVRMSRRYESITRLPPVTSEAGTPEASLDGGTGYVSEPRTVTVDVRPLEGSAGRLRVTASPGRYSRVLLRLAHRVERTAFEKRLLARTINTLERKALTSGRSSLGFLDIPGEVRESALSHWHQRLTAAGREGRDYTVRRLLIGPRSGTENQPDWVGRGFEASPATHAAINISGPVTLRVWSASATRLGVELIGQDEPSTHAIAAQRWIELTLDAQDLTSVIFSTDRATRLAFAAAPADADRFFGREPPRLSGRWLEITPDLVQQRGHRLHPAEPMTLDIAPGQPRLGLNLRCLGTGQRTERELRIAWKSSAGAELGGESFTPAFEPSLFERAADQAVSESLSLELYVPPKAERVLVFGDEDLIAMPFVPEPGVEENIRTPPFDREPPEGLHWRNAPFDVKDWSWIRPENASELARASREVTVVSQVRLERDAVSGPPIAPRTLEPRGDALSRPVFAPTTYAAKYGFPDNGWVLLDAQRPVRNVVVPPSGELSILYVADADRLGEAWSLSASAQPLHAGTLSLRSGTRRFELTPGEVRLGVEGLGASGVLLAQAAPSDGSVIVRRQTFYALRPGETLDFDFQRRPLELGTIAVTIATEGRNADVQLAHAIDAGRPLARASYFRHRATDYGRVHELRTGALGEALIWSEPFGPRAVALPDRLGRLFIPLGDDLPPGPHRLTLRHPGGRGPARNRYWVRAVLVGRVLGQP